MVNICCIPDLAAAQLVEGTPLHAGVFSLLADCTLALRQRLEVAGPEPVGHHDRQRLVVLAAGMSDAGMCSARQQVGSCCLQTMVCLHAPLGMPHIQLHSTLPAWLPAAPSRTGPGVP